MSEHNCIDFGGPGHHGKYCVHVKGCGTSNGPHGLRTRIMPAAIKPKIAEQLGDGWRVEDYGTYLEISNEQFFFGYRDDTVVVPAVEAVLGECKRSGDVAEMRKFGLPMIQVLEGNRIVKCAVIGDDPDHWIVKPVEVPYLNEKDWKNGGFHKALMRISKNDTSAEPIAETFDISVLPNYSVQQLAGRFQELWEQMAHNDNAKLVLRQE